MKRRLSALLAAAAALVLLTACAGQQNAAAPAETAEPEAGEAAPGEPESGEAAEPEAAWDITMRDIIEANHVDRIFPAYGSIRIDYQYAEDPDWRQTARYTDADMMYYEYVGEQDMICRDGSGGYLHVDEDDSYGSIMDFTFDPSGYDYFTLDPDLTAEEEILSVEEDGDVLSVTTRLPAELFKPYFPEGEYPYADGDYLEEAYTLNASDYAMLSESTTLLHADGSREALDSAVITYGADRPAQADALLERKAATENIRTGTVILDPGTPEERSLTVTAVKGDYVYFTLPDGYETVYDDPACTVEFEGSSDRTQDFVMYSKQTDA